MGRWSCVYKGLRRAQNPGAAGEQGVCGEAAEANGETGVGTVGARKAWLRDEGAGSAGERGRCTQVSLGWEWQLRASAGSAPWRSHPPPT